MFQAVTNLKTWMCWALGCQKYLKTSKWRVDECAIIITDAKRNKSVLYTGLLGWSAESKGKFCPRLPNLGNGLS